MIKKKKKPGPPLVLLPMIPLAPARQQEMVTYTEQKLAIVLDKLEDQLGGRHALRETLLAHPKPSAHLDSFLKALLDVGPNGETNEERSLSWLCLHAGLTTGELLRSYQEAILHVGQTLAKRAVAECLPKVTIDVMERALPSKEPCKVCSGAGSVTGKKCDACGGLGEHRYVPDLERQKVALDLGEMFPKKGGGLTIAQQQVNLPPQGLPLGSFARLQQTTQMLIADACLPAVDLVAAEPREDQ